jgi:hypothetical protein
MENRKKFCLYQESNSDLPVVSSSLYRLSLPGSMLVGGERLECCIVFVCDMQMMGFHIDVSLEFF